jgi:hypothetical protein
VSLESELQDILIREVEKDAVKTCVSAVQNRRSKVEADSKKILEKIKCEDLRGKKM